MSSQKVIHKIGRGLNVYVCGPVGWGCGAEVCSGGCRGRVGCSCGSGNCSHLIECKVILSIRNSISQTVKFHFINRFVGLGPLESRNIVQWLDNILSIVGNYVHIDVCIISNKSINCFMSFASFYIFDISTSKPISPEGRRVVVILLDIC